MAMSWDNKDTQLYLSEKRSMVNTRIDNDKGAEIVPLIGIPRKWANPTLKFYSFNFFGIYDMGHVSRVRQRRQNPQGKVDISRSASGRV